MSISVVDTIALSSREFKLGCRAAKHPVRIFLGDLNDTILKAGVLVVQNVLVSSFPLVGTEGG